MQQPKKLNRLLRALSRQGLDVSYDNKVYSICLHSSLKKHWQDADAKTGEVLLPEDFPLEAKALKQLANLANGSIFNADRSGFCEAKLVGGTAAQSNCFLFESGFAG